MDVGDRFPHFVLKDENGEALDSQYLDGMRYVIFAYPRNDTPNGTVEVLEFNELFPNFMLRNILVLGVSRDTPESHFTFRESKGIRIKLLSDTDGDLMNQIDGSKTGEGNNSTFIIGKEGNIEAVWRNLEVKGHAHKVLEKTISLFRDV